MDVTQKLLYVACSLSVLLVVKWIIQLVFNFGRFPPGPWGLPVVGYAPWIGKKPHETFTKLAQKYGNIFSITLGKHTMVVLNDWASIQETLVKRPKEFSARPLMFIFKALAKGKNIGSLNGPEWIAQRNLLFQVLKNIGISTKSMENRAMEMVNEMMNQMNKMDRRILSVDTFFFEHILKFNWKLIAGVDSKSIDFKDLERTIFLSFKSLQKMNPINIIPWLRFFPPFAFGFRKAVKINDKLLSIYKNVIDQHVINYKEEELTDFIDFYLSEIKKKEVEENKKPKAPFNIEHLLMTMWSLFPAAVDTVETTILWGFLFLASNPHVQKRAQGEMDRVIGRHRLPTMDDMPRLPYVDAMVMEIHRKASVVHLSIPHKTVDTVKVLGRTIPKGTTCLQNIYAVHHDPKLWKEPQLFKPERFIDENNAAKAPPYLTPYSIGPRVCLGVPLSDMELRLIFSCLLHRFSFTFPPAQPKPSLEPDVNVTLRPRPYSLLVRGRVN